MSNATTEKRKAAMANYRLLNAEKIRVQRRKYYEENREKEIAAAMARNAATQKGILDERRRENYRNHKESSLARSNRWRSKNPEKVNANKRRWRKTLTGIINNRVWVAKRNRLCHDLTGKTVQIVYSENITRFGVLTCELCYKPIANEKDSIEHFHPVSRRESYTGKSINERSNLGIAHMKCNHKKATKTKNEWFADILGIKASDLNCSDINDLAVCNV